MLPATLKMTGHFPRPLRARVREYVGCDLTPLVHLYDLIARDPSVLDDGVGAIDKLIQCSGLSMDAPQLFVQNLANLCAAFYEPGFLWLRALPICFNVTMTLCFALYRQNLAVVQKYYVWATESLTNQELRECDAVHNDFVALFAHGIQKSFVCLTALQFAAIDTGDPFHFRRVCDLLDPISSGTRRYSSVIRVMLAARGQLDKNSTYLTEGEWRAIVDDWQKPVVWVSMSYHSSCAVTYLLREHRNLFPHTGICTAMCLDSPHPMEVVEILFENDLLNFEFITENYNPPEKAITENSYDFLQFVIRKFGDFDFVQWRYLHMSAVSNAEVIDLYEYILEWARGVVQNNDVFWRELGLS